LGMSKNEHFRTHGYGCDCRSSRTLVDMMFISHKVAGERRAYENHGETP
jgi:hypothetical protein